MKDTLFKFGINLRSRDPISQLQAMKGVLLGVQGVVAVKDNHDGSQRVELQVLANFGDAEAAKKLHRKLMRKLMSMDDIRLAYVSTNLTDVFG